MQKPLLTLPVLLGLLAAGPTAFAQAKLTPHQVAAHAATTRTIQGQVVDAYRQPLPGVTVLLKGTQTGTATDTAGHYTLAGVPAKGAVLVFSYVGYVTRERPVPAKATGLNIVLEPTQKTLNEIVVTGKAVEQQRRDVSYSVSNVSAAPLQGRVAGVAMSKAARKAHRAMANSAPAPDLSNLSGVPSGAYQAVASPAPPLFTSPAKPEAGAGDTYAKVAENAFHPVAKDPLSTFSLDVDNASYTNVRRFLNEGQLPPREAVRLEEMLNYFHYQLPAPPATSPDPVRISAELSECPWAPGHQLARIGIQTKKIETARLPPANLVFLVDVSGSMMEEDRLPLVQASLRLLVKQLRPQDHVALVAYAGAPGVVLPPTAGAQQEVILEAIDRLTAGGSTAGGAGLRLAYSVARHYFLKEGNNRVLLATDGDFNVGESSDEAMEQLIVQQRETGVFLTVLGVGRGNLRDSRMEMLADKGNGNYAYLDNLDEARRTLVAQFGGTLFTVAKDVKLQVEFNPARVANYRLIGYENRLLANEDFNNDRKDAGDLGAGHTVTALYELVPVGADKPLVDPLKYQLPQPKPGSATSEVLTVKLRYKEPQGNTSKLLAQPLVGAAVAIAEASADQQFAAAVAEFGLLLRQSEQRGMATYGTATQLAQAGRGSDVDGYRAELIRLIGLAQGLAPAAKTVGVR